LIDELERLKAAMAKNAAPLHTLFARSKLWMARHQFGGPQG